MTASNTPTSVVKTPVLRVVMDNSVGYADPDCDRVLPPAMQRVLDTFFPAEANVTR